MSKLLIKKINAFGKTYRNSEKNEEEKVKELLESIKDEIVNSGIYSDRYITKLYTITKGILRTKYITDENILRKVKPENKLTMGVIDLNYFIRDNRKMKKITYELVELLASLYHSKNATVLGMWLMINLGVRISEIAEANIYTKAGNPNIFIKGIKKGFKGKEAIEYEIIPLASKTKVMKAYKIFKKLLGRRKTESLNQTMNIKLKKLTEDKEFSSHTLRGIYVNYLFKFHNPEKLNYNNFIKENLRHETPDSSLSYNQYEIDFDTPIRF